MAVVQALNHLDTIVLGLAIRRSGIAREVLETFSTPMFRGKLAMIDKVFSHPELHAEIIAANPHAAAMIGLYGEILDRVGRIAIKGNAADLAALMRPDGCDEKDMSRIVIVVTKTRFGPAVILWETRIGQTHGPADPDLETGAAG